MRYATLQQAKEWIATPIGASDPEDACLTDRVNEIRGIFYNLLTAAQIGADVVECFALQMFRSPCAGCPPTYCGVSLPYGVHSVIGYLWRDSLLAPIDRWRFYELPLYSYLPYMDWGRMYHPFDEQWRVVSATFPTERDIQTTPDTQLKILCRSCEDVGKIVKLRFRDRNGIVHEEEIPLTTDWTKTQASAAMIEKPGGVVFAEPRDGRVVLAEEANGNTLSVYEPGEQVPAYKRVIPTMGGTSTGIVELRCRREWVPLTDPLSVVETGNLNAWQEAARFVRLHNKHNRDENDRRNAGEHLELAKQYLLGERRREQEENMLVFAPDGGLPKASGLQARRSWW